MSNKAFRPRICGRCGITFIQLRAGHPAFSPRPYARILRIVYSEQSPSRIYPSNRVHSKELCSECAASFARWLGETPVSASASTSVKEPKEPITMPTLPFSLDPSVETLATQRADRQQTADTAIKLMRNLYRDLLHERFTHFLTLAAPHAKTLDDLGIECELSEIDEFISDYFDALEAQVEDIE